MSLLRQGYVGQANRTSETRRTPCAVMPKTVPSLELFLTLGIGYPAWAGQVPCLPRSAWLAVGYSVLFYAWALFGQALGRASSEKEQSSSSSSSNLMGRVAGLRRDRSRPPPRRDNPPRPSGTPPKEGISHRGRRWGTEAGCDRERPIEYLSQALLWRLRLGADHA